MYYFPKLKIIYRGGKMSSVIYKWHEGAVSDDMKITQVSGILWNDDNKVLIYKENENFYRIPGGKPEKGESIEQTLIRESLEEVNVWINDIEYIGYQEVIEDNGIPPYAQVRMIAKISKIGENIPDPDNGQTYERLLISLDDLNKYLKWQDVGDQMVEVASKHIKEKKNL